MSERKELVFYLNGKWVDESDAKIPITDHSVLFGAGIFEGIRIYNGGIFKLSEHLDRLYRSARVLRINVPISKEQLTEVCKEFVRRNNMSNGHFRIIVTPGQGYFGWIPKGNPVVAVFGEPVKGLFEEGSKKGIRLKTSAYRRNPPECLDPRAKTLNYVNNLLHNLDARAAGADDALVLDIRGFVAELSGANFFIVKDNAIKTPTKYWILEGVTRATVMELAEKEGLPVSEEDITLYDVYNADEAFTSGSGYEIVPIVEVDARKIGNGELGPVTKKMQQLYRELTHSEGPWFTKAL